MHERNRGAARARAGLLVDRRGAGFDHHGQRRGAVVDAVADVVQTLAPLLEVLGDRRIGGGCRRQLDVGIGHLDEGFLDPIGINDLAVVNFRAERLSVVGDCRFEIMNGDGDVVDFGELHDPSVGRRAGRLPPGAVGCHHRRGAQWNTHSVDLTPEQLERAEFATSDTGFEPDAVRELLRRAADRIRTLERDGVKSVSGSVGAVLEQAVKSGEELVASATTDAEAVRAAAEVDAARIASDAAAVAAKAIAEGEHSAAELVEAAESQSAEITANAEKEARGRSAQVINEAQQRLDRLLAAERDVHDRLQTAMADIQDSVTRVGVNQGAELALTVEDPASDLPWADESAATSPESSTNTDHRTVA